MRLDPRLILTVTASTIPIWAGGVLGIWKANLTRSTDPYPKAVVRFEPHAKGEVFTLDWIDREGRAMTSSTILYLDGKFREFQGFGCSGAQSSRRLDSQTVEILRTCTSGEWTTFIRRLSTNPKELVLEITEQKADGRRLERRLMLEK